jgi:hypothetical protein
MRFLALVLIGVMGCSSDEDAAPRGDCTIAPCPPNLSGAANAAASPNFDSGVTVLQDGGSIPDVRTDLGPDWPF